MPRQDAFYAAKEILSRDVDNYNQMIIIEYEDALKKGRDVQIPKMKKMPSLKKILKTAEEIDKFFIE